MKISIKGFIFHKIAETFEDCFDRYAVNTTNHKFSVADGVSKSFFPGIWAELLVNSFVDSSERFNQINNIELVKLQKKWLDQVTEIVKRPNQKYFVQNLFVQGKSAAATFVGLQFYKENDVFHWEATALGDSFLFFIPSSLVNISEHFPGVTLLSSKKTLEFDNFPDFFDSRALVTKGRVNTKSGLLRPGRFILMTDALSEWFIAEKQNALDEVLGWNTQKQFERRISALRSHDLQNDDSAILIIDVVDDDKSDLSYHKIKISKLERQEHDDPQEYDEQIAIISNKFTPEPAKEEHELEKAKVQPPLDPDEDRTLPIPLAQEKRSSPRHKGILEIGAEMFLETRRFFLEYILRSIRPVNEEKASPSANFTEEDRKNFENKIGRSEPRILPFDQGGSPSKDNKSGEKKNVDGTGKVDRITKKF
jgi:hypothetical protein